MLSSGVHNKVPQIRWLEQESMFSWLWRSELREPAREGSARDSLPGLQKAAFSLCSTGGQRRGAVMPPGASGHTGHVWPAC